jgi:hypothetical protein
MSVENVKIEINIVADIQARFIGIHSRRKIGMIRRPTVREIRRSFARAEILAIGKRLRSGL